MKSSCLIYYCLLGWGIPLVLLVFILLLDHLDQGHLVQSPNVGMQSCFLHEDSWSLFLHLPLFIIMLVNTGFYIYTVINIFRTKYVFLSFYMKYLPSYHYRKTVNKLKMKENVLIFTKLFLVMGILWGFEILSFHVHSHLFTLIFGILNISRGSFMFIIFILKSSVFSGLKKLVHPQPNPEDMLTYSRGMKTETSVCDTE